MGQGRGRWGSVATPSVSVGSVWGWDQHGDKGNMAMRSTGAQGQCGHRVGVSITCTDNLWGQCAHKANVAMGST